MQYDKSNTCRGCLSVGTLSQYLYENDMDLIFSRYTTLKVLSTYIIIFMVIHELHNYYMYSIFSDPPYAEVFLYIAVALL